MLENIFIVKLLTKNNDMDDMEKLRWALKEAKTKLRNKKIKSIKVKDIDLELKQNKLAIKEGEKPSDNFKKVLEEFNKYR